MMRVLIFFGKLLLLSTWMALSLQAGSPLLNPHFFPAEDSCPKCHKAARQIIPCTSCHTPGSNDHPVNISNYETVHVSLPLSPEGKITCYTCHDPHNQSEIPPLLRLSCDQLCLSCHHLDR
jgi:predicted CXXCH cytochrome family protein